jgi:hypothetical protein
MNYLKDFNNNMFHLLALKGVDYDQVSSKFQEFVERRIVCVF